MLRIDRDFSSFKENDDEVVLKGKKFNLKELSIIFLRKENGENFLKVMENPTDRISVSDTFADKNLVKGYIQKDNYNNNFRNSEQENSAAKFTKIKFRIVDNDSLTELCNVSYGGEKNRPFSCFLIIRNKTKNQSKYYSSLSSNRERYFERFQESYDYNLPSDFSGKEIFFKDFSEIVLVDGKWMKKTDYEDSNKESNW